MDKLREKGETGLFRLQEEMVTWKNSRKLIILIVAIALLLVNISFFFLIYNFEF